MNNKIKHNLITFGLVLLLSIFVIFLRINAVSLPSLNKTARVEVYKEAFEEVKKNIDKEYKNIPQEKKDALIQRFYKDYLKQNKHSLEDKIRQKAKEKKDFYQNDNGHTYLFGIDSYYWMRLIDNLIHKGHIGDSLRDGQDYDVLVDTPIEKSLSKSMHLVLGSLIYKVFGLLRLNVDYEAGLYLIPLLFSILLAFLTFFVTRLLSQSNLAAFFATLAVNLSPLLLQRTMLEWLDTDIYNVFFPLLIFGSFLFVYKHSRVYKKVLGLVVFSLSCALYASVWQGWWYIFDLLIVCGLIFILNDYFYEGKDKVFFKNNILWLFLLFVGGAVSVGLVNGRESLLSFILEPQKIIFALKDIPRDNWPNIFLTVAELKKVSPYTLAEEAGGAVMFSLTALGSIYLVLSTKILRQKEMGIGYFCLFIWLGVLYYVSLNAVRLALLLVVPLGLMFGIVIDLFTRKVFKFSLKFPKKIHFTILGALVLVIYLFVSFYVRRAIDISYYKLPLMNDAWYKSLTFVKNNSRDKAIINSWWDYGHWFTAVTGRCVLFDGKTQNSPVAFWVAKVLTTDSEEEAVGILRMLNISKNKAFDLLESYGLNHVQIVNMLEDIAKLKEPEARIYLEKTLGAEKINGLLSLLYAPEMPEVYFIASFDIMTKMRAISHIANWDFKKGDIWLHLNNNPFQFTNYLSKEYGYNKEEIDSLLKDLGLFNNKDALGWISKIDNIYTNSFSNKFKKADNILIFDNAMTLDLSNYNAYIFRGPDVDIGMPYSVVYLKDGVLEEHVLSDSNLKHSVLLFSDGDSSKSIFLDRDLAKSVFSRMYFLKGEGLKYFKKVHEEKTLEGNYIFIYKIEWPS